MMDSPHTDPELHRWLGRASESTRTTPFVRTIAEAAFMACSPDYVLLRPVLVELKRRYRSSGPQVLRGCPPYTSKTAHGYSAPALLSWG